MTDLTTLSENLLRFRDTCNVYVVRDGRHAVLVDFGSGDILDHRAAAQVDEVREVLVTHHHRDQVQGLDRAAAEGIAIWVPPVERELIEHVDDHWQARVIDNNYDVREDRFSLLHSVPVTGAVREYGAHRSGRRIFQVLPTPGHTIGSVSYIAAVDGRRVAFTGDLIYGPGKVWSLASTMWAYGEHPGAASTILSLLALRDLEVDLILPSHGEPITDPGPAIDETVNRLLRLLEFRGSHWDLLEMRQRPYVALTPHLLQNRTSHSYSYVLLSESGSALLMDFGYDFITGLPSGHERATRRPLLYTIDALRRQHGVKRIEVVLPTHYHDDHVAGYNLLREVEGTEVWAPAHVADVLRHPHRYDLPCLWYDPIPVARDLPVNGTVQWQEYEIGVHDLPGHTQYAAAYSLTVDGTRVVVSGDQQDMAWQRKPQPERLNYIYQNRFSLGDFRKSARLYARLRPELMIGGHWPPRWIADDYLQMLREQGELVDELHRNLLPLDEVDLGLEGFAARLEPYRSSVPPGAEVRFSAEVRNPYARRAEAVVALVLPDGWVATPPERRLQIRSRGVRRVQFTVRAGSEPVRRARVAVDVSVDGTRFGQQAEALVTVTA